MRQSTTHREQFLGCSSPSDPGARVGVHRGQVVGVPVSHVLKEVAVEVQTTGALPTQHRCAEPETDAGSGESFHTRTHSRALTRDLATPAVLAGTQKFRQISAGWLTSGSSHVQLHGARGPR